MTLSQYTVQLYHVQINDDGSEKMYNLPYFLSSCYHWAYGWGQFVCFKHWLKDSASNSARNNLHTKKKKLFYNFSDRITSSYKHMTSASFEKGPTDN